MHALRDTLNVPSRLGWNGDPCAPTDWDAWEGVTCNLAADGVSLIVTHMYALRIPLALVYTTHTVEQISVLSQYKICDPRVLSVIRVV